MVWFKAEQPFKKNLPPIKEAGMFGKVISGS